MEQTVQIVGALLILSAFVLAQRKVLDTGSPAYLVLNLVGAGVLAVVAAVDEDWGFVLLESVWALVSAASLAGHLRARRGAL